MAQASTLVPVTKMKKAQAWTLALSWGASPDARYRRAIYLYLDLSALWSCILKESF